MTHPIDQERLRIARDICALVALENPDTAAIFARVDKESFRVDHADPLEAARALVRQRAIA